MTRYLTALMALTAPLFLGACIGYSERVVVRERGHHYHQPHHRGYWGPPPGRYHGRGWNRY